MPDMARDPHQVENALVTPANVQDRDAIAPLLAVARQRFASLKKAIADGGYQGKPTAYEVLNQAGIPLEIVKRSDTVKGFYVLPKRWIVERTYGWLGRCRRLAKDYENLSRSHVGFIILAMIRLMLRRIVRLAGAT
jgi:transposase